MAAAVHVPGGHVGKTVVLRLDHGFRFAVAILPATHQVDLRRVSDMLGGAVVELASEADLADITFEGNRHCECLRMKWRDFVDLENPLVGSFAVRRPH
jgi:prolyl-tRNA editing enzyme YbaK/EbsC (Cys-tRNA(Pro) deacylase)